MSRTTPVSPLPQRTPSHSLPIRAGLVASLIRRIESPAPALASFTPRGGLPGKLHLYSNTYGPISSCLSVNSDVHRPSLQQPYGSTRKASSDPLPSLYKDQPEFNDNKRDISCHTTSSAEYVPAIDDLQFGRLRPEARRDGLKAQGGSATESGAEISDWKKRVRERRKFDSYPGGGEDEEASGGMVAKADGEEKPQEKKPEMKQIGFRPLGYNAARSDSSGLSLSIGTFGSMNMDVGAAEEEFMTSRIGDGENGSIKGKEQTTPELMTTTSLRPRATGERKDERVSPFIRRGAEASTQSILAPTTAPASAKTEISTPSPFTRKKDLEEDWIMKGLVKFKGSAHERALDFFERFTPTQPSPFSRLDNHLLVEAKEHGRQISDAFAHFTPIQPKAGGGGEPSGVPDPGEGMMTPLPRARAPSISPSAHQQHQAAMDFFNRFTPTQAALGIARSVSQSSPSSSMGRSQIQLSRSIQIASDKEGPPSIPLPLPMGDTVYRFCAICAAPSGEHRICNLCFFRMCHGCRGRLLPDDSRREIGSCEEIAEEKRETKKSTHLSVNVVSKIPSESSYCSLILPNYAMAYPTSSPALSRVELPIGGSDVGSVTVESLDKVEEELDMILKKQRASADEPTMMPLNTLIEDHASQRTVSTSETVEHVKVHENRSTTPVGDHHEPSPRRGVVRPGSVATGAEERAIPRKRLQDVFVPKTASMQTLTSKNASNKSASELRLTALLKEGGGQKNPASLAVQSRKDVKSSSITGVGIFGRIFRRKGGKQDETDSETAGLLARGDGASQGSSPEVNRDLLNLEQKTKNRRSEQISGLSGSSGRFSFCSRTGKEAKLIAKRIVS